MGRRKISEWQMDKSQVSSTGGMVVAKQEEAAIAGIEALETGGNAIDAAVAAAWVMNVMEPYNCTIGGAGYLVYRPVDGPAEVVDFSVRAPAAVDKLSNNASPSSSSDKAALPYAPEFQGVPGAAVPGTVAGLSTAIERFGRLPLAQSLQAAIGLARDGMPVSWLFTLRLIQDLAGIRSNPKTAEIFLVDGDPGMASLQEYLPQTDLAATLEAIAADGPDAFYKGSIAARIVADLQRRGGIITEDDFAAYQPSVVPALAVPFHDFTMLTAPPPSPGLMTLQAPAMLAGDDLAGMGHNSAEALHLLAEAFHLAFADRDAYLGDPEAGDIPTEALLDPAYLNARRDAIDPRRAMGKAQPGLLSQPATGTATSAGGTTHICAVDAEGNAVSLTQTLIGGFGGIGVAGDTGVIMNTALQWFDPSPGAPNSVAPGKRPLTNMTPIIVERDGLPVLLAGAPGSRRITNAVSQVMLNALVYGMPAQQAISAPRIDCSQGHIVADDRIDPAVIDDLRKRGHEVEVVHEFVNAGGPERFYRGHFSRPAAIVIDSDGVRHGGDYPFAEGTVIGIDR